MISTLITLPYELARLPLVLVDNGLSDRLPETSGPRVTLDRAIGSVDKLAGTLLHNRDIARRGADRIERTEKLLKAASLEQEADEAEAHGKRQARTQANKTASAKKAAADQRAEARTATV